jgi:hypothetical protein
MIFRSEGAEPVADHHDRNARNHPFIFDGKQAALITASEGQVIDVAVFRWENDRSPLNTPRWALPLMFDDVAEVAYAGVVGYGGKWGTLAEAAAARESLARARASLAAHVEPTAQEIDEALVAAHPDLGSADGVFGSLVAQARRRIFERKKAAA